MEKNRSKDEYPSSEARRRFEAALRGARLAGHKPMKSMTPKRKNAQRAKKKPIQR